MSALVLAFVIPAGVGAGVIEKPPKAELATTGNDSELLPAVPISKKPGRRERVVMSLSPDKFDTLAVGDRLRISGEVQVSTTCVKNEPRCIGAPYEFNPTVSTRIVLSSGREVGDPSFALSTTTKKLCKQQRPNRNHHCTLVIPNTETVISDPAALPCPVDACHVNMILGASNKKARPANRVVLGADLPNGTVKKDKGRLNIVHSRSTVPAPTTLSSHDLVNTSLPLTEGDQERRRSVYSVPLDAPRKGEVIAFDSSFGINIAKLRFNTFVATKVIVATSPTETDPSNLAKSSAPLRANATESNGFNCTLGPSGYSNPCTVFKAGATRIIRDVVDDYGLPGTLYLNVVASAKPLLAESVPGAPVATLLPGTGLNVLRWTPPPGSKAADAKQTTSAATGDSLRSDSATEFERRPSPRPGSAPRR